ncbi:MAG: hypothetical protein ACFFD4_28775 [Candidatus Odinarchaeota archaeon]
MRIPVFYKDEKTEIETLARETDDPLAVNHILDHGMDVALI